MRWAILKISSLIVMINIVLLSSRFETSRLQFKALATVSACLIRSFFQQLILTQTTEKQKIQDEIAKLKYKDPNSPRLQVAEQELVRAEATSLVAEAQLSNITREKVKAAFSYQFDAIQEQCEKLAIIAGYGKHLLELIDETSVTPGEVRAAYDGYDASRAIIQDCESALTNWVPSTAKVHADLSTRARTLSQRRKAGLKRNSTGGIDLAGQDAPLKDSASTSSWVPASEHERQVGNYESDGAGEEDEHVEESEDEEHAEKHAVNGDHPIRGRQEERELA
jgi:hypothetical protein